MSWKVFWSCIVLIAVVALAGFLFRAHEEAPPPPTNACPTDAKVCPDGTSLGRTGPDCTFPTCPPPNVELPSIGISFALPVGYSKAASSTAGVDGATVIAFSDVATDSPGKEIIVREYPLGNSSTTPSDFIRGNAIMSPSGAPAPVTAFTSSVIGSNRFSVIVLERFEGEVDIAYYLARANDVLRFDAISRGVDWTNPELDVNALPANQDLRALLPTLEGN